MKKINYYKYPNGTRLVCTNSCGTIVKGEIVVLVDNIKHRKKNCITFTVIVAKLTGEQQPIATKYLKPIRHEN